jgi:integrase
MISPASHHGLRVSELVALRWSAIDWKRAHVRRTFYVKYAKAIRELGAFDNPVAFT